MGYIVVRMLLQRMTSSSLSLVGQTHQLLRFRKPCMTLLTFTSISLSTAPVRISCKDGIEFFVTRGAAPSVIAPEQSCPKWKTFTEASLDMASRSMLLQGWHRVPCCSWAAPSMAVPNFAACASPQRHALQPRTCNAYKHKFGYSVSEMLLRKMTWSSLSLVGHLHK
jgi:hypothetical protein